MSPSPLCGGIGGRGLKHCKIPYVWHLDFWRGCPGAQEAQALASCFLISPDASKMPRMGYFPHSGLGRKGFWGRLFRKELQITESEIQKASKNELKWIQKCRFGFWGHSYCSELRSECNGMPPGAKNSSTKIRKTSKTPKLQKNGIFVFSYGSLWVPIGSL